MQAQSLTLRHKKLGALPLVEHFLAALNLPQLLAQQIHPAHYVQGLQWLVRSFLLQPNALYRIGAWAASYDLPASSPQPLSDDALGRALDRLFQCDRASLMTALVVGAARTFALQTSQIHNDSTSIKFCGAYEQQDPGAVQLRRGFSKDHRPDLKQLVYCLSVSADGAVPIHFKAYDGNQNDDGTHWESWQCLCRLLNRCDFLYVADCKLCVNKTLLAIDQAGGRFITVLPRGRAEIAEFARQTAACQVRWEPLWSRSSGRQHHRREAFDLATGSYQMKEGFRLYWYRSPEKALHDARAREERLATALRRLQRLNERRGRGPKTEPAIRRAAENTLAHYRVQHLLHYQIQLREEERFVKSTRGPRTQRSLYRRIVKPIPELTVSQDQSAIAADKTMDGVFPLVSNAPLSAAEVLKKHKYQPCLERRHFLAKSVLEISPVFLKKNTRIEALMLICFISQLVAALIERTLRQNMASRKIPALAILPESRDSKAPAWAQIRETFADIAKHELYEKDQLVKLFVDPLTDIQKTVLGLLDIEPAVYK